MQMRFRFLDSKEYVGYVFLVELLFKAKLEQGQVKNVKGSKAGRVQLPIRVAIDQNLHVADKSERIRRSDAESGIERLPLADKLNRSLSDVLTQLRDRLKLIELIVGILHGRPDVG